MPKQLDPYPLTFSACRKKDSEGNVTDQITFEGNWSWPDATNPDDKRPHPVSAIASYPAGTVTVATLEADRDTALKAEAGI